MMRLSSKEKKVIRYATTHIVAPLVGFMVVVVLWISPWLVQHIETSLLLAIVGGEMFNVSGSLLSQ